MKIYKENDYFYVAESATSVKTFLSGVSKVEDIPEDWRDRLSLREGARGTYYKLLEEASVELDI